MNASLVWIGLQIQQQDPAQLDIGLLDGNAQGGFAIPVTLFTGKKKVPNHSLDAIRMVKLGGGVQGGKQYFTCSATF
jgi:hypothetical protein